MRNSTDKKVRYGWVVVATSFVIFAIVFGIQFSFAIFFKPLEDTFGWSRASISGTLTIHLIVYGLSLIPAGWALARFNTRAIFAIAALLIGSSLALCSRVSEPWQLYVLYGVPLGIGVGICGPPLLALVVEWFSEKRGMALGIASAGIGFGALVGAPLINSLIASGGWRNAFVVLGAVSCATLLVCAYFMRRSPRPAAGERESVTPRGHDSQASSPSSRGITFKQAIRTKEAVLIALAQSAAIFALRTVQTHIVAHAVDTGISPSIAALAIGTIGGLSIIGRLGMGFAQDKIGARRSMITCLAIQGTSMLALPFIKADLLFFVFAMVFGFTYGGDVPQVPALVARSFGLVAVSSIYGLVTAVGNMTGALGPIFAGYVFDLTGSYTIPFLVGVAGVFGGLFCIWKLRGQD